jgi:hypothetical protein
MRTQVINNRESLVQAHVPPSLVGKRLGKNRGKNEPPVGPLINLLPGMNLVDSELLGRIRKENKMFNSFFSMKIESSPAPEQNPEKVGHCILVEGSKVADSAPTVAMKAAAAKAMIAETLNPELLRNWLKEEARPDIRRAIDAQMVKLKVSSPRAARRRSDEDE